VIIKQYYILNEVVYCYGCGDALESIPKYNAFIGLWNEAWRFAFQFCQMVMWIIEQWS
jgi:hypothetical protein